MLLAIAGNPEILQKFGVVAQHRSVGSEEMFKAVSEFNEASEANRAIFPLLYLLSETAGLSPKGWAQYDGAWLRGVLAVPWIFLVVPFFGVGMMWLMRPEVPALRTRGLIGRLRASRLLVSPWGALFAFIAAYMAVCWQVGGETTRWRLPDMPVIAAIATAGWRYSKPGTRDAVLFVLVPVEIVAFAAFYMLRG